MATRAQVGARADTIVIPAGVMLPGDLTIPEGAQGIVVFVHGRCADMALSLSPLDPMIYFFNSLASTANLIGERYERAVELATQSLRENRLHTPTLRTLAAALVHSGRLSEARETVHRLLELEPGLTVGGFRARYPGRDSPQAARFAAALLAAGLPP